MATISIKTATDFDAHQAISVMVLAFNTDPAVRWIYPNPHQYLTHFPDFVKVFAEQALEQHTAYYVDSFSGAAFWLPPSIEPDQEAMMVLLQRTVSERLQEEVFAVFEQVSYYHPSEPHWYLSMIGVESRRQGQCLGSALIKHGLIPCDLDQKLAYLESSNPAHIPLYEQHGFELLDTIRIGSAPPIFPMLRQPR